MNSESATSKGSALASTSAKSSTSKKTSPARQKLQRSPRRSPRKLIDKKVGHLCPALDKFHYVNRWLICLKSDYLCVCWSGTETESAEDKSKSVGRFREG